FAVILAIVVSATHFLPLSIFGRILVVRVAVDHRRVSCAALRAAPLGTACVETPHGQEGRKRCVVLVRKWRWFPLEMIEAVSARLFPNALGAVEVVLRLRQHVKHLVGIGGTTPTLLQYAPTIRFTLLAPWAADPLGRFSIRRSRVVIEHP